VIPETVRNQLEPRRGDLAQFAGYAVVSGAALVMDFAVYSALLTVAKFAFVAAVGGYVSGVGLHYLLSSRLIFASRFDKRGIVAEAPAIAKFFAAGASGLLVTVLIVGLLADLGGVHPLIAKVIASGFSFVVVFLSLRLFVFNPRAVSPSPEIERDEPCLSPTMG
jgi:putative flippase GtrA